jgi:gliding motility-associated-like protein
MKYLPKIIPVFFVFIALALSFDLHGQNISTHVESVSFRKDLLYAKIKSNITERQVETYFQKIKDKAFTSGKLFPAHSDKNLSRIYKISIVNSASSMLLLDALQQSSFFEYVEYAPIYTTTLTPNDLHVNQWHLKKILAEQAWGIRTGNVAIRLAIVDDAVDIQHEDLSSVISYNTFEIANNGIDDDLNGYVDDYAGWQAYYRKGNPNPPFVNRHKFTHGTHCAGIAAASTNNNIGIASIGYNISIVAVSCADSTQSGVIAAGYEGIIYAADLGVNVISLSWGGSFFSNTGQQVVDYAVNKGIVICAAAGNDNDNTPKYPAAYNGVVSVAATDINDKKASFSNFGSWVDISAPGVNIWSSVTGGSNKYDYLSGTSMACPMVAGLCGLMLSQNEKLTPLEIESCLKSTALNLNANNPNYNNMLGAGRINAFKAIQCVSPLYTDFEADKTSICPGGFVNFTNLSSPHAISYKWTVTGAIPGTSVLKNPQFQFPLSGVYTVKIVVSDGVNYDSLEQLQYIKVYASSASIINATQKIRKGETVFLTVNLTGEAPWSLKVSDGSTTTKFNAISTSPFYFDVSPTVKTKYFPVSVSDNRCAGMVSDTVLVLVDTAKIVSSGGGCGNFDLYTKTMNLGGTEIPHSIVRLQNQQYAIIGISTKGDIGGNDIFITKFNQNGHIIWTKYYGTTSNEAGYPLGLFEDTKGDLYIHGVTGVLYPETALLIKIDSSGTIIYSHNIINNQAGDSYRQARLLSDNRLAIVGTSGVTNDQAAQIFVMNPDGTVDWSKTFNSSGPTEHFISLSEINKKLYVVGHTSNGNGGYGSMANKMDMDGNIIWQKYIDFGYYDAIMNMVTTQNAGFMVGAWISANGSSAFGGLDIGIVHSDTNGNKIWSKIIGKSGRDDIGGFLRIKNDYYVSGVTNSFDNGNAKVFVIKMDINGNIKWSKIYGKMGEQFVKPSFTNNIIEGYDGSIMIVGGQVNSNDDIVLIKIDECGNSNCPWQDIVFNVQNDNTTFSNSSLTDLGILPQQSLTTMVKNAGLTFTVTNNDKCVPIQQTVPKCKLVANFSVKNTCAADSVSFTDSSYDLSGKNVKQYKWVFYDNSVMSGRKSIKRLFPGQGTYKTTLIVFSDTPNMCSDTVVKFITFDHKIKGKMTIDKMSICKGDSAKVQVGFTCGISPFKIQWLPGIYFSNPNSFSSSVSVPSSMWVKVIATDKNNTKMMDSVFVTVNSGCCKYNAMIQSGKYNFCLNDSLELFNISQNSGATYKWYLSLNGNVYDSVSNSNLGKIKLSKPGKYTFRLLAYGVCRSASTTLEVFCHPLPFIIPGRDTLLCAPSTVILGNNQPIAQRTYTWMPKATLNDNFLPQPTANITKSITYTLVVKDLSTGCMNYDTINVLLSLAKLDLGNDTTLCEGAELILRGTSYPNTTYQWNDGSNASSLIIKTPGKYYLTMTDKCGTYTDTVVVDSKVCFCEFFMPNAFSPNDDATNEFFPYENLETVINIIIFNRWGEKIYDRKATNKGWDGYYKGEIVQQDVYLYLIQYVNCGGRYVYLKGTFTLLR